MVWGKEPRYFQSNWHILRRIASAVPLVMTAKYISLEAIPPNVTNLGIVSQVTRNQLLAESLFLIGLGDPVLGATPFEAIASGAAYINPRYQTRKKLWQNSEYACTSQHTFAGELGAPYVHDYQEGDAESAMQAVRRVLSWNDGRGFAAYVPPQHSPAEVERRLEESMQMRFVLDARGDCGEQTAKF